LYIHGVKVIIKVMIKKIDIRFALGALGCFGLCYALIMGSTGVEFNDSLNEMFMFVITCIGGLICLALIKK
jgi:Na+/proline symporter